MRTSRKVGCVLLTVFLFVFTLTSAMKTTEVKALEFSFLDGHADYCISEKSIITDFSGNSFTLLEFTPTGYAIYDDNGEFIEGSYQDASPYAEYMTGTRYYLGPCGYYVETDEGMLNIVRNEIVDDDAMSGASYALTSYEYEEDITSTVVYETNSDYTYVDDDGFTTLKDDFFFRKSTVVVKNDDGICGIIAIGLLLSYLDTFQNSAFVGDGYLRTTSHATSDDSQVLRSAKSFNVSPYAVGQLCNDVLCEKYLYTILNIESSDGYPMANAEIRKMVAAYLAGETTISTSEYKTYDGALFYTHARPRQYIDEGLPVLLSLTAYDSAYVESDNEVGASTSASINSSSSKSYHTCVAYGYNKENDTFLVHLGYRGHSSQTILSSATIYSYYAFEYTGEHQHSYNYFSNGVTIGRYYCGCGQVFDRLKQPVSS